MSTIAVYGNKRQQPYISEITSLLASLTDAGFRIVMHPKIYDSLIGTTAVGYAERVPYDIVPDASIALSFGGDGTFLRTAQWVGPAGIPILGINTGHLGYLAAIGIDMLPELPRLLAEDSFTLESRCVMQVLSPRLPEHVGCHALNEVAIAKEESASMIHARVRVDGELLADYKADGLICSTPTGSTAYNLSVGGPIVQPTVPVWIISAVAAHSLSMRPFVTDSSARISILTEGRSAHVRLAVDGRSVLIDNGTEIVLGRAPFDIKVLRLNSDTFAATLRRKLHWADGN